MQRPFDNADQNLLYQWTVGHLRFIRPEGSVIVPDPTPLDTEQIVAVLEQVGKADAYRQQTVSVPDRDGHRTLLRWVEGKAVVEAAVVTDEPHPQRLPYGASVFIRDEEGSDA